MAKNRKSSGKRVTIMARKASDVLISSSHDSDYLTAKPLSVVDIMYPSNIHESEKEAIRLKLEDEKYVYVKQGPAEAFQTRPRSVWTYILIAFVALALLACCAFGVLVLMSTVLSSVVSNPVRAADQVNAFLNASNQSLAMLDDTLDRVKKLLDIGQTVSSIIKGFWNLFR